MRIARGPRPWTIHLFALILFAIASFNLISALLDLPGQQEFLRTLGLGLGRERGRDFAIIASSAWYTIELIPIALVWLLASRFARSFITAMAVLKALLILGDLLLLYALPGLMLGTGISLACVLLLYTPSADVWFAQRKVDPETFS